MAGPVEEKNLLTDLFCTVCSMLYYVKMIIARRPRIIISEQTSFLLMPVIVSLFYKHVFHYCFPAAAYTGQVQDY